MGRFRCVYHGKTFTLFPPNLPLTAANLCKIIAKSPTRPVQHFAVPYVLKLMGETEEGTAALASFEAVSYAGAAVPVSVSSQRMRVELIAMQDDLGDRLVAAGVPLVSVYGTTGQSLH